jgi:quinol monooxygenase YgiN
MAQVLSSYPKINIDDNKKPILAVIANIKVLNAKENYFIESVSRMIPFTLKENGCHSYVFHQSMTDPTEFAFYEQWESEDHLNVHLNSVHMKNFFEEVSGILEIGYPQIKTYHNFTQN